MKPWFKKRQNSQTANPRHHGIFSSPAPQGSCSISPRTSMWIATRPIGKFIEGHVSWHRRSVNDQIHQNWFWQYVLMKFERAQENAKCHVIYVLIYFLLHGQECVAWEKSKYVYIYIYIWYPPWDPPQSILIYCLYMYIYIYIIYVCAYMYKS